MAEFCFDCWNKLNGMVYKKKMFTISRRLDLCEECEQYKPVIVCMKKRYVFAEELKEWAGYMRTLYGKKKD